MDGRGTRWAERGFVGYRVESQAVILGQGGLLAFRIEVCGGLALSNTLNVVRASTGYEVLGT